MPESESSFQPTMTEAVRQLRARFPNAPFLTLGQTVLWDEPVKAAFCRALEVLAPEAQIVAAVHDTDYFAKLSHFETAVSDDRKFLLLPHNDGDTRDLWSAAGEISCLFGSETVPTRHKLVENGVAFDRVARDYPGGAPALLNDETNAWGWRALVHTEPRPLLAGEVLARDIAPALLEQLRWAFEESLHCLGSTPRAQSDEHAAVCSCPQPCEAREVAARIVRWVEEYSAANPEATLSELYRYLTPRLWALVRGGGSCNLQTSHSLKLFRFNRETAHYPRFRFLDLFLNPQTREIAKRSYDDAVRGSGIYTLDQFGGGALPFDVVIPGCGRGTLRLEKSAVFIETEPRLTLRCDDCDSVSKLAARLETEFGADVVVVGKAVSLISMLAHELIFVFHEKASSYTRLTQKMNAALRASGIELNLHPLLRLEYATWDALTDVEARFTWPAHLASAFGQVSTPAREVAARWKEVCASQDAFREQLKNCRASRELMQLFAASDADWQAMLDEYSRAREVISNLSCEARVLQSQSKALHETAKAERAAASKVEREKGEDFRANVLPLLRRIGDIKEVAFARLNERDENGAPRKLSKEERKERAEQEAREEGEVLVLRARLEELKTARARFDEEILTHRTAAKAAQEQARVLIAERVEMEKSEDAQTARATISRLEYEAELEKLRRVRDALIVSESLRYTNLRPTAWWLPLVSPDGKWFEALVRGARARIEEI
jgi:hypothetical protein